jgi:hypothetical protein
MCWHTTMIPVLAVRRSEALVPWLQPRQPLIMSVHIDRYSFGTLVADGHEIHTDVLVTPSAVREHWWRRARSLRPADLAGGPCGRPGGDSPCRQRGGARASPGRSAPGSTRLT